MNPPLYDNRTIASYNFSIKNYNNEILHEIATKLDNSIKNLINGQNRNLIIYELENANVLIYNLINNSKYFTRSENTNISVKICSNDCSSNGYIFIGSNFECLKECPSFYYPLNSTDNNKNLLCVNNVL